MGGADCSINSAFNTMAAFADEAEEEMQPVMQLEVRGPPLPIVERYYTKYYAVGE